MAFPFAINGHLLDGTESGYPAIKYGGASYSRQAIDGTKTGRNQVGTMLRQKVAEKDKWQLEFVPMTSTEMTNLLTLLDNASFTFSCPRPLGGGTNSMTAYCGDRSAAVLKIQHTGTNRAVELWGNFKVNIIEM